MRLAQVQRVEHRCRGRMRAAGLLGRRAKSSRNSSSEWRRALRVGRDAEPAQQPLRGTIEQPDERIGNAVKPVQRIGDQSAVGSGFGSPAFGCLFAGDDVQEQLTKNPTANARLRCTSREVIFNSGNSGSSRHEDRFDQPAQPGSPA